MRVGKLSVGRPADHRSLSSPDSADTRTGNVFCPLSCLVGPYQKNALNLRFAARYGGMRQAQRQSETQLQSNVSRSFPIRCNCGPSSGRPQPESLLTPACFAESEIRSAAAERGRNRRAGSKATVWFNGRHPDSWHRLELVLYPTWNGAGRVASISQGVTHLTRIGKLSQRPRIWIGDFRPADRYVTKGMEEQFVARSSPMNVGDRQVSSARLCSHHNPAGALGIDQFQRNVALHNLVPKVQA
jgi:hypothetical protein